MVKKVRNIEELVEEQVTKWNRLRRLMAESKREEAKVRPVITISREPGTGGTEISMKLAEGLDMDFMSGHIIQKVADSVQMSEKVVASLDERAIRRRDDLLTSLFESRHLWPDNFLRHLMKVVSTVGYHGNAVILGRGANHILPPEKTFRVRLIAPMKSRIGKVMADRGVSRQEAEKYVIRTDSDRTAFIRKYFHTNISDPVHYDLIIDTSRVGIEGTVETISHAFSAWEKQGFLKKGHDE
jgi:cytidylate kinase